MGRNEATRRIYSMVNIAKASMLRYNGGASSQRKFYDDVQNLPLILIPLKMLSTRSSAMHWVSS